MTWWSWMILGAILLAAELLGVEAAFFLAFIGVAAMAVGLLELAGAGLDAWVQWLVFAVLAIILMVFFRKKLYTKLRGDGVGYEVGPAGETVTIQEAMAPGQSGRLSYRGTDWTVVNDSDQDLSAGETVRINRVDGLKLNIVPVKE